MKKRNNKFVRGGCTGIKNQARANIFVSVLYQFISAVCSLILPRFILLYFGSDVNGILQSISQLLTYTVIIEGGIGGLVIASFYRPLAFSDEKAVSDIFNNAKDFFAKISYIYIGLVAVIAVFVKKVIRTDFDFWYVSLLAVVLGINYYFNYYFALAHRMLMRADQKIRIIQGVQCITLIFNTVICTLAMKFGAGIHVVKIISTLIFLVNPIVFRIYVKKHYNISKKIFDKNRELPKKRDGMVHHIAFFVHMNTDIVILSVFSGTREVSVYSVYNSIIYTIESFFMAISDGISASIGNLIVKDEKDALNNYFELYQTMNTFLATFFCIAEAILIVPFVSIYTKGVTDADYIRPMFSYIAIAAQWFFCIRIPCSSVINAAGHYRQTSIGAYIEAILNICISLALVRNFGLCGIAFGTAAAMMARTIYMAWYLSKELLFRKMKFFVKDTLLNAAFAIVFVYLAKKRQILRRRIYFRGFYMPLR